MLVRCSAVLLTLCLLVAGPVAAEESAPLPGFHPDSLELLPMPEYDLDEFYRANEPLIDELAEVEEAREELAERRLEEPGKDWLKAEAAALRTRSDKAVTKLIAALAKVGIDRDAVVRAAAFPMCSSRVSRFAIAQLREVRGIDPSERVIVNRVAAAVDAALATIDNVNQRATEINEHKPDGDGPARGYSLALLQQRHEALERFWRFIDCTLSSSSKRLLRARLPVQYHQLEEWSEHAIMLPGLTLGQAARLRAIDAGSESEGAADRAAEERLSIKLFSEESKKTLSVEEREKAERELDQVWERLTALHLATLKRVRAALGEALWGELLAIPSELYADLRTVGPEEALEGVEFTPAQIAKLGPLVAKHRALERDLDREYEKLDEQLEEMGPDSPQMGMMEMKETVLAGTLGREIRALMRDIFTDVMTPDQVVRWVLMIAPEEDD